MTTMNPRQWFQARLKWAVLEEGYGLTHWRESEHIFLSENRVLVVEIVELLRQFESVTRNERWLLRRNRLLHARIERTGHQDQVPEIIARVWS